jgi:ComF family protein
MSVAKSLLSNCSRWVFPEKCSVCRMVAEANPCARCLSQVARIAAIQREPAPFVDEARGYYLYEASIASIVTALKYHRHTGLTRFCANEIHDLYLDWCPDVDLILPVPIHRSRMSWRGFNQATLLCEKLPAELVNLGIVRTRRTPPQVRLTAEKRMVNLQNAFHCKLDLTGKRVLLVDDVFTTGATTSACAQALKAAGATWVGVAVLAMSARALDTGTTKA